MRSLALFLTLAICNGSFAQGVVSWISLENQIVLEPLAGRTVGISGLELNSQAGLLSPGPSVEPFQFQLRGTPQQVTYGSLALSTRIQESTTLDVRYDLPTALEMGINPCEEIQMGAVGRGTLHCPVPGDVDFSGNVSFADFLVVSENFGQAGTDWRSGDFDWDRRTDFTDFLQLSKYFGSSFYDFAAQAGEPVIVRASTIEEVEHLAGNFSPPPLSGTPPHGEYFIDDGLLWTLNAETDSNSEQFVDNTPITIVAPDIDFGRATHFGSELTRVGDDFELVSVRLRGSIQTADFRIPDDLEKSLVVPVGTLESGQYDIRITRYEFNDSGIAEFDVSGFLADPANFELPDGPLLSSVSTSTLTFQVEATGAVSVPEPQLELFSVVMIFFGTMAIRRPR